MEDRSLNWMENQEIDELTRLRVWQDRLSRSNADYSEEYSNMDAREELYKGRRRLEPLVPGDTDRLGNARKTSHINNVIFENIESMVSSNIPTPKVTAVHKEDEKLASVIEHWLRNQLDRLPFEMFNDMAERTVPIQGGTGWLVEWDANRGTHNTVGEIRVTPLHPKLLAPQPGVYTGIQDMDWLIVKCPTTKASVKREYGVDVFNLGEEEPELRKDSGTTSYDEMLTKYVGYEKNTEGGIDRFVWVNDTVLENIENYQARHQQVCRSCRRRRPSPGQIISNDVQRLPEPEQSPEEILKEEEGAVKAAIQMAGLVMEELQESEPERDILLGGINIKSGKPKEPVKYNGGPCPYCGSDNWTDAESEYEEIIVPIRTEMDNRIPGAKFSLDENGESVLEPTLVPYYKPNMIPVVLQRNVSVYGQLLGNSDVDAIQDQQNTVNRLEQKIIDRLVKAGTKITLPPDVNIRMDTEDNEIIRLANSADMQFINTFNFTGNVESEIAYMTMVYEESRRILGITNSFQGREDRTATSGVAKEFQAAQSAGRLESKRVMKAAAYAELFEMMFKFQLAYSDEPRSVSYRDHNGDTVYETFNRYDFLKKDADGVYYWDDEFLFSVDSNAALENNRSAMWQETRMNLQTGAFGNPAELDTLIMFWSKMEQLHYPGAGDTRKVLENKLKEQQQAMQMQAAALMAAPQNPEAMPKETQELPELPAETSESDTGTADIGL